MMSNVKSVITLFLFVILSANIALAQYSGGDGSEANPYQIATAEDLIALGQNTGDYGMNFIMTQDIDLSGYTFDKAVIAPDTDTDSGFDGSKFTGSFDGRGNVISNLKVRGVNYCGLFGYIWGSGGVKNILLENVDVAGTRKYIGGLCGYNYGIISDCSVSGSVSDGNLSEYVGGLCGYNYGNISGCYSSCTIVSTGNYIGGLCGYNKNQIRNCYSTGSVDADGSITGGFCGYSVYGSIYNSYTSVNVRSGAGFCKQGPLEGNSDTIENCYYYLYSFANDEYAVVLDDNALTCRESFVGFDFVGDSSDGDLNIWEIEEGYMPRLSWQESPGFSAPHQLEQISTTLNGTGYPDNPFVIADYDDLQEFRSNSDLRVGYYSLEADIDLSGVVYTESFIHESFSGSFNGKGHIISGLTIDSDNEYVGFFAKLASGKVEKLQLENADISGDVSVSNVGILCGYNMSGLIFGCYSEGILEGGRYSGGICGANRSDILSCASQVIITDSVDSGGICGYSSYGSIRKSYTKSSVISSTSTSGSSGGVCGTSYIGNVISDCFSICEINGIDYIGGIIGRNYGNVDNSYAAGVINSSGTNVGGIIGDYDNGDVKGCFWDRETSGLTKGVGNTIFVASTGLNTADMKTDTKYLAAGWDFSDADGDAADWHMLPDEYPAIVWDIEEYSKVIPDLTGMTLGQAQDALTERNIEVRDVAYIYSAYSEGLVCGQTPSADSVWQFGLQAKVDLMVSLGIKYSGSGTEADPFLITSAEELIMLGNIPDDYDKYFVLTNDIDLSDYTFDKAVIAPVTISQDVFNPGISGLRFTGNFNGNNHTIRNLRFSSSNDCLGLFGGVSGAEIYDLVLENVEIEGQESSIIGCLSGYVYRGTVIDNCTVQNSSIRLISTSEEYPDYDYAGLLVGYSYGSINNCHVFGSIVSDQYWNDFIGGLCGFNYEGSISGCSADVNMLVNGEYSFSTGGFVGFSTAGIVANSYSSGNMSVVGETNIAHIGGFCGLNQSRILNCYSDINITVSGMTKTEGVVDTSFSVGGICGTHTSCYSEAGYLAMSYFSGTFSSEIASLKQGGVCGYQVGENGVTIADCFWNLETSGFAEGYVLDETNPGTVTNVLGLTTAEMMTMATYVDAGWDFSDDDGDAADWQMVRPGEDYPRLAWQEPVAGDIAGTWGVDMADLELLAAYWLVDDAGFDIDGTEGINMLDFGIMAENWMEGKTSASNLELPSRLIGHWALDETEGSVAFDSSEYTNDGTIFGEPAREAGIIDGCYTFNGTSDYIIAGSARGVRGAMSRTISAYIKADEDLANGDNNLRCVVSWGDVEGSCRKWFISLDNLTGQLAVGIFGARLKGGPDLEDGQWHHIAVVMPTGATNINQVKLYVDGQEVETNAGSISAVIDTAPTEVVIGAMDRAAASAPERDIVQHFAGSIDDVQIHNIALSDEEIAEMAQNISQ